ncbi:helix-turn-helix transcriptional regulator [Leucobacter chromiireducens]|uniref:helix-turn-helix transcriptional regulator n=1 Tax=Leucobacter chromiireducens TaxID=283877 RepID=UPI000F6389DA|nr:helix-turn-helix transcriptional regulator [Leucobacter chromiireducens]
MPLPLLAEFPLARAAAPARLRDAVGSLTGYGHAVLGGERERQFGVVNGRRIGALSLVYVAYATRVRVVAPPTGEQVVLVIPFGPMHVTTAGHAERHTEPFVLSGSAETMMLPDPEAGALVGTVPAAELLAAFREGFPAARELSVDLAQARPIPVQAGPALRRVWSDFARRPEADPGPLVDRLLIGLTPHLRGGSGLGGPPPAYLAHAVRHLRRHLGEAVSLAELGEVVGIGSRQLQLAFQAHLGCTAQEYLRDARLDRALAMLRAGGGASGARSIAAVAAEVGIPHSGRFSQYFATRFGVRPSEICA